MAKIPLRVYNREIEAMIDRGEAKEAVIHGRHVLKYFPKHIDTYRLLGKAYLELQRYAEAADVLQRILSTVPDDFISQIGLSIIREDEGNLDAAIWHMERAFEAQPSNTAVQDELRRLYGRRDGIEPPKIRLTRGALIRMYARGELYQQAIAEIRAALAEDPQRIDLEVILARMYFLSGQKVMATETCSRLVSKLPYCFEANKILADVLPGTSRATDGENYQARVYAMDPYLAYLGPNLVSSADVPDNAVTLDHLDEIPAEELAEETPLWAKTAGVEWRDEQEILPDWFTKGDQPRDTSDKQFVAPVFDVRPDQPAPQPDENEEPIFKTEPEEEQIPDWMKEAGWQPGTEGAENSPETFDAAIGEETAEEIAQAEIPDWLQTLAPEDTSESEIDDDQAKLAWLNEILPSEETLESPLETDGVKIPEITTDGVEDKASLVGLPETSLETPEVVKPEFKEGELANLELEEDGEIPDWLTTTEDESGEEITPYQEETTIESGPNPEEAEEKPEDLPIVLPNEVVEEEIPDWLKTFNETEAEIPAEDLNLNSLEEVTHIEPLVDTSEGISESGLGEDASEEDLPDWLRSLENEEESTPDTDNNQGEISSPKTVLETSQPVVENENEWLAGLFDENDSSEPEVEESTASDAAEEAETPEWLAELTGETTQEAVPAEAIPDWLADLSDMEEPLEEPGKTVEAEKLAEPEIPVTISEETQSPEHLEELRFDIPEPSVELEDTQPTRIQPIQEGEEAEIPVGDAAPESLDQALAWLETLAARQGADESTLLTAPEERLETPPDWVVEAAEEAEQEVAVESAQPQAESEEVMDEGITEPEEPTPTEKPKYYFEAAPEPEVEEPAEKAEEIPEWLKESLEVEAKGQETPEEVSEVLESNLTVDEIDVETPEPEVHPTQPDARAIPENMDLDSAFAWLESLAAKQGAEEETLLIAPEDRMDEAPEWVKDVAGEEQSLVEPLETPESAPLQEGKPTWQAPTAGEVEEPALPEWFSEVVEEENPDLTEKAESAVETEMTESLAEMPLETEKDGRTTAPVEEIPTSWFEEASITQPPEPISEKSEVESWLEEVEASPVKLETQTSEWVPEYQEPEPATEESMVLEGSPDLLKSAQAALEAHNIDRALGFYNQLIQKGEMLDETIHDLRDALYRYPIDISIWQTLGDAYMRNNHLQEALDAYTKAEELLR